MHEQKVMQGSNWHLGGGEGREIGTLSLRVEGGLFSRSDSSSSCSPSGRLRSPWCDKANLLDIAVRPG